MTINLILLRNANFFTMDGIAFGNLDLCLDDIDTGNHFGNGMLNLNAGINFNEIKFIVRGS
ncbi:hypothetical protein SDC9_85955 [bioreactor metagenome]|uniref:Uncharacterized protein n=1 Tax=bioreactor metagenome TaxID=1076179 RepID=A0A644ZEL2_9ZZZZ